MTITDLDAWEKGIIRDGVPVLGVRSDTVLELISQAKKQIRLRAALDTAIRWLRRLEKEHPGCLNDDAISKHLESSLVEEGK